MSPGTCRCCRPCWPWRSCRPGAGYALSRRPVLLNLAAGLAIVTIGHFAIQPLLVAGATDPVLADFGAVAHQVGTWVLLVLAPALIAFATWLARCTRRPAPRRVDHLLRRPAVAHTGGGHLNTGALRR
jgi:hypothetical protein